MVQKWFKRFKDGDTSLKDEEGRGRRLDFDDQVLLDAVEEYESLTTRILAEIQTPKGVPKDVHCINRSLKNWMNKVYDDLDELVDDVKAWIASKNHGFFERGIDMLPEKWEAVIEVYGEYAPE
uniref:Transposase n=1 Tax=Acrobeloides nanus TaxID=290746 RepID=A0A914CE43_9BILA